MTNDPFANIVDETVLSPVELRDELLADTRRSYAKIRKTAVQRERGAAVRASMLADVVRGGKALDLWLLTLALEPVLAPNDPLPLETWADLVGVGKPASESAVSRGFATLERLDLVERTGVGRRTLIRPRLEDGSGGTYFRPGSTAETGPGFFTLPHEYWTTGLADRLQMPGKVALLIGLCETTQKPTFDVATTRAELWYGISERTLERGYLELSKEKVLLTRAQQVRAKRTTRGVTTIYHRALDGPYSMDARHAQQAKAQGDVLAEMQKKTS